MVKPVLFGVSYRNEDVVGFNDKYNLHVIGDDGYLYYAYVTDAETFQFTDTIKLERVVDVHFADMDLSKIQFASFRVDTDSHLNITMFLALPVTHGYRFYVIIGRTGAEQSIFTYYDIANTITTIDARSSYSWSFLGGLDGITKINQETNEIKSIKLKDRVVSIEASMYPIVAVGTTKGLIISRDGFETDNYQYFIGGDTATNKLLPYGVGKIFFYTKLVPGSQFIRLYMLQESGISRLEIGLDEQSHIINYVWGTPLVNLDGYQFSLESSDMADGFVSYQDNGYLEIYLLNPNKHVYDYILGVGINDDIQEINETKGDDYYNNDFSGNAKSLIHVLKKPLRTFVLSPDKRLSVNLFADKDTPWHEIEMS